MSQRKIVWNFRSRMIVRITRDTNELRRPYNLHAETVVR